jgi:putative aldouronate transport system permease protein
MFGLVIVFKKYSVFKGIWGSPWVGLENFRLFLSSPYFFDVLRNSITINIYSLVFGFPAPIILALLLNEVIFEKAKKLIQTVTYLPHFISWAVAGSLFYIILSPSTGFVNIMIKSLGFNSINFMGDDRYFRGILVVTGIWKEIGWGAIVYMAALTGVDTQLYEAAFIDGAGRFQRLWNVTLPSISNIVVIMLILQVGHILDHNFEQVFVMINDTVLNVGETIEYFVYRQGLLNANNFSYAAAVGLFKSLIGFFLILMTNKISKKIDAEGGIW